MGNRSKVVINWIKKAFIASSALAFCAGMTNASLTEVRAAPVYKIEFRAGAHGTINGSTKASLSLEYGAGINAIEPDSIDSGYWFTGFSPELADKVTENEVYVAQYAKLINAVEYRVNYVDNNGNSLATQKVAYANEGETIHAYAVAIDGYQADAADKSTEAGSDGAEITFVYTVINGNAAGNNAGNVGAGQNAANVAVNAGVANGNNAGGAGNTTGNAAAGNGANTANAGNAGAGNGAAEDAEAGNTADNGGALQAVDDEAVPQGQQNLTGDDALQEVDDEEVPLSNAAVSRHVSAWTYVGVVSGVVIIAGVAAFIISRRYLAKKKE